MRRQTTTVKIGNITLSSEEPVMVQSMLSVSTMDTDACVEQAIKIIEAGGQLVRITAQGIKEAKNLKNISSLLREKGYDIPLSADIHFMPEAAMVAARYVEKVRINPGNFADKRATFIKIDYTEQEYQDELERIKEKFTQFLDICKECGTAVRIGTNHGSLSDRIMSRYGNTPAGMVEATLEYLRICRKENFDNVVISLKSSDSKVMVDAVRLLVSEMDKEGMHYPLHLGVTEAGEGEDGRIRSAIGIGTLLNEGIGDTIRVSLTEAPESEIPVAKMLAGVCNNPVFAKQGEVISKQGDYIKPVIVSDISAIDIIDENVTSALGFSVGKVNDPVYGDLLTAGIKAPEIIYTETLGPELTKLPEHTVIIFPADIIDMAHVYNRNAVSLYPVKDYADDKTEGDKYFIEITDAGQIDSGLAEKLKGDTNIVLVLYGIAEHQFFKTLLAKLEAEGIKNKVIIRIALQTDDKAFESIRIASQTGSFFLDKQVYGIWIKPMKGGDEAFALDLSRNILQSAGLRRYKTEFVSCPGCGRTLFDLRDAVAKVKAAFGHLSHLKIAVMGCVVNGPGEMGDADYGYVGAGNGKVNLYKGRKMERVAVPEHEAIDALQQLIIKGGDWREIY